MISLSVFASSFIAVSFIGRAIAEVIVYRHDKQAQLSQQRQKGARTTNTAVQRYYSMRGARNHTKGA